MSSAMNEKISRVYAGSLQKLPSPPSKIVRIFTSSTFTDTTLERNALMEEVYPKIKEFCREKHGLDFQVVDMRWGVRDEATDDHKTTELCMNEIRNCQRLSVGPNFVVFLCQKYGYRPLPTTILASELDLLKETLRDMKEEVSPLETWYRQDSNAVPPVYVLQPISSILLNFNNKRMAKLQEQDAAAWWDVMGRMQELLRKAARAAYDVGHLSHEEMHNYFMSVTEREVINGILKAKNTSEHCLGYVRHINDINLSNIRAASKFVDISQGHIDPEATKLLSNLRDERVPAKLAAGNIARFSINWTGRDGMDSSTHAAYINELSSQFFKNMKSLVEKGMAKQALVGGDRVYGEVLQHLHSCQAVSSQFHGRHSQLDYISSFLLSSSNQPLILHGHSGCGKTSVLAKSASLLSTWLPDKQFVLILRFLGTSPDSSSIIPLLKSVCDQIALNYGGEKGGAPNELSKLFTHFKAMTGSATKEKPLFIFLDSLDLLSKADGAHELLWFPPSLPPHVKLLASTTPEASKIYENLQRIVEKPSNYLEIPVLGEELGERLIEEWLKDGDRTLSPRQFEIVRKVLRKSTVAIFVKLVFATVYRWKSYSRPQDTILAGSVQESIQALFERVEGQHGKLLVSHALSYITAARSGVSESELEDLISLDDKVLDDVYQYHLPPVRRIPPLLWTRIRADLPGYLSERDADGVIVLNWYHKQFHEAARERYFRNMNHFHFTHSSIADYFLGIWGGVPKPYQYTEIQRQRFGIIEKEGFADRKVPQQPNEFVATDGAPTRFNTRKLNQLPFHLLRAQRTEELFSKCLFNYQFLQAKINAFPLQALLADFEDASQTLAEEEEIVRELNLVADGLRLSASLLSRHPYMLPAELLGRLLPLASDYKRVRSLLVSCDVDGHHNSALLPVHHSFHSPGGPLKFSMEEHPFAVFGMKMSSDSKMLVTVSNQFIVWDLQSGDVARVVKPGVEGIMFGLALSPNDKLAASYTNNNEVILMSLITGDFFVVRPEGLGPEQQMAILGIGLTPKEMVFWTKREWFLYGTDGELRRSQNATEHGAEAILEIKYFSQQEFHVLTWNGDREEEEFGMESCVDGKKLPRLPLRSCMTFSANHEFLFGCGLESSNTVGRFKRTTEGWLAEEELKLETGEDDRILTLQWFPDEQWLIAMDSYGFHIWDLPSNKCWKLKLPDGVRNIPLRPMVTTTPAVLLPPTEESGSLLAAGVRTQLYIFNIEKEELVQTLDAHFGRVRLWNLDNIFEKSFPIRRLDKPVEKICVASQKQRIAAVLTRKYVALWDLRKNVNLGIFATSAHGAVVTQCVLNSQASILVTIETDVLLVWETRTQSVRKRAEAPNVYQLFFLQNETLVVTVSKQEDTPEQKVARITARTLRDWEEAYRLDFHCRFFREVVVLKGEQFIAALIATRGKEAVQVIHAETGTLIHKVVLQVKGKELKNGIQSIGAMPHNPNQVYVVSNDHLGTIIDIKNKKILRTVGDFSGPVSSDGKLGLLAPPRGGLSLIDLKRGVEERVVIKKSITGVHDVIACFSGSDQHVLYYYNGNKNLRVYRVADGALIGTFKPHAQLTFFAPTKDGREVIFGGEDGSIVALGIVDPKDKGSLEHMARKDSRPGLAAHLGMEDIAESDSDDEELIRDLRNIRTVERAAEKFKAQRNQDKSAACSVQ